MKTQWDGDRWKLSEEHEDTVRQRYADNRDRRTLCEGHEDTVGQR